MNEQHERIQAKGKPTVQSNPFVKSSFVQQGGHSMSNNEITGKTVWEVVIRDWNYWHAEDFDFKCWMTGEKVCPSKAKAFADEHDMNDIYTHDKFVVKVEAKDEDEALELAKERFLDGEYGDALDSDYLITDESEEHYDWSQANPKGIWAKAYEVFGDSLEIDHGNMEFEINGWAC